MRTSFLDYSKIILDKVSFDQGLFLKEYEKAVRKLPAQEILDLNSWLRSKGLQTIIPEVVDNYSHSGNGL